VVRVLERQAVRPTDETGAHPALPIGFAHRGGAARRDQQNTLAAFRRSRRLGAAGFESDVALTADGVPVLIHPGILARLRRPVSGLRRDQLPAHVPALEEVYREFGGDVHVALDMTAPAAVDRVVAIAREHGDPSRLWLTYWHLDVIADWRRRYPDVRLVFPTLLLRMGTASRRLQTLRSAGVDAVNLHHRSCTPSRAAVVHQSGLLLFGWGARNGRSAARALRNGADGVFCDDSAAMVAALAAERLRRAALSAGSRS
jgi:glycerophosphoryl diester phosphodiesterase